MPMIVFEYAFNLIVILMAGFVLLVVPYGLILHFLMPRAILEKYFRPPHFGEFERALYTGIPYAPMRTVMLMGVMVFPSLGKKRKLTELHHDTPRWYKTAAKVCLYGYVITGGGSIAVLAISAILLLFTL